MKRVGVFVCHCGVNIAGTVNIADVVNKVKKQEGVALAEDYVFMCSDPGQNLITKSIKEHKLDKVVVACCSPNLHESTFRMAAKDGGLNPYLLEIANIREQCSWVHPDKNEATAKAIKIINSIVEKVKLNESLEPVKVPVTKKACVIGGGVAGIQAALDLADAGHKVILVEKTPSIGGHMAQLSETFPTLDCSQCILTPKMVSVSKHPNITIYNNSEVEDIEGIVGNFKVKIKRNAPYVNPELCTVCGDCSSVCPVWVPSEYDQGLAFRKAIYIPFAQSIPATYTLDIDNCLGLSPIACGKCKEVCEPKAIDYDVYDTIVEEEVGVVIVATGYDLYPVEEMAEYGYGKYQDVIDGLMFERILSATGPTGGEVLRPSDGKVPKNIVFIQCSGSRDPERHNSHCSKICCMYTAKHAKLYKHKVHDGNTVIFYIDIRSGGKGYEEFIQETIEHERVTYIRGKVAKVFQEGEKITVWGVDTLTGQKVEIQADLVVLAMAMVPSSKSRELIRKLKLSTNHIGFLSEAHPKLKPVETVKRGFFLCGADQGPKDIPESVAQGSAAASKALALLSSEYLLHEPDIAMVIEEYCCGCGICVAVCPYSARVLDTTEKIARVEDVLCEGCGSCISACPTGASQQRNLTDNQIFNMVESILKGV